MSHIRKIGVLTSGGDAPGMNAAIRAVVRTAMSEKLSVVGIGHGYQGLINKEFIPLYGHSVANIIQRGGTFLKTSRCPEFQTKEGLAQAYQNLQDEGVDALVVIGGDGTFRGALSLGSTYHYPIVGLPGTIDNDLFGTDYTIGYDTAINTVVEAVDKLRDTAGSHDNLFFVEVMGRDAGFIALNSGIGVGAEDILIPETVSDIDKLVAKLEYDQRKHKTSGIIIVAEGDELGGAKEVAEMVKERLPNYHMRVTILGHIQRGGSPTCADRVLASRLGYAGVKALLEGRSGVMIGQINNKIKETPFSKATKQHPQIQPEWLEVARVLAL
ncbi:MAG: 6-phosphofructokinase [Bacteroidales bacterium]|nr:6-phosphofructokinase [Bacteroidales bacterium]